MKMKHMILKKIALTLAVLLLVETLAPSIALALTSGPAQPEFQGFQQVGASDMVDLFTGDFSHNIPLCEIGGYPLNMVYNSNPGMDDEASWVGLGWSLNPGSINRQMRGLPDDFKGDELTKEFNMAPDRTVGISVGLAFELFGKKLDGEGDDQKKVRDTTNNLGNLGFNLGINVNNRRGVEMKTGINFQPMLSIGSTNKSFTADLGLSFAPSSGLQVNPSIGFSSQAGKKITLQNNISAGFNSRRGLRNFTVRSNTKLTNPGENNRFSGSSSYSFTPGPFAYTPTAKLPLKNESFVFHGTVGIEFFGANPNLELDGFISTQSLKTNSETQYAYGYLHLKEGKANEGSVLDYNSEINGQFKEDTPHLPLAYGTPDIFAIAGHGVGGSFRAVRNDIGIFRPAAERNSSVGGNLGVEIGGGGFAKLGLNATATISNTTKGEWNTSENELDENFEFTENGALGQPTYESVYFKSMGEKTRLHDSNGEIFKEIKGTDPIRIDNTKGGFVTKLKASEKLYAGEDGRVRSFTPTGKFANINRIERNQVISYLTNKEASKIGLDRLLKSFPTAADCPQGVLLENCKNCGTTTPTYINRNEENRKPHHISEITATTPAGQRYVYGLPIYNNLQEEVTFSIDETAKLTGTDKVRDPDYGLVEYTPDEDNSVANDKGVDEYFDLTSIPAHAHSYLLSGVLSADYMDRTGDGITDDDLGNAVKFNYTQHNDDYDWRIPAQKNKAKFHEGLKATIDDDRASYLYGKKEIWYPYSIESRTMVARFYTSKREDGYGVKGKNGGFDFSEATALQKLDKISIFSKADLNLNKDKAIPIKNIHFEYDYSLCPGVVNNSGQTDELGYDNEGGKLTLKKVYFTYGNNNRGKLNAYLFNYKTGENTSGGIFQYNMEHYDRWGCLKINPANYPLNRDYPYVLQEEKVLTKEWAGAWNLSEIILPSGSKINIEYEPDDYAYVQNKRAGQMMEITGFRSTIAARDTDTLEIFTKLKQGGKIKNKRYVEVKLPFPVDSEEEGTIRYLENIEQVYFNCSVLLDDDNEKSYDRVSGYFKVDGDPIFKKEEGSTKFDKLWLPVKYLKDSRKRSVHPVTFAALQKMRLQIPELIYPGFNNKDQDFDIALLKSIVGLAREVGNVFKGFEQNSMRRGYGKTISAKPKQSWIRLNSPEWKKLGGNSRVSKVTISDEWTMGGKSSTYGQKYNYEMAHTINGVTIPISSGVACYEPAIGGEENMMKLPLPYKEKYLLAPKDEFYSETPIGEALYPSPIVGYRQVMVTDIANDVVGLVRNKTGKTIHDFYTAKEFPTIVKQTRINPKVAKSNPLFSFLKIKVFDARSYSQGFTIELNDMHGKPRRQAIFDKNDALLSATAYNYKEKNANAMVRQVSSEVDVLNEFGEKETAQLGVSLDTWVEMLEENNQTNTAGIASNADVIPISIFPVSVFRAFPVFNDEKTQFKAATITKLVQRCGILDNVVAMENGSTIKTTNTLFDKATGNVLLTETQNEFDDAMYNFSYPAHWMYAGMGQAYENIGATIKVLYVDSKGGTILPNNMATYFNAGDEVLIKKSDEADFQDSRYFIEGGINSLTIIDDACNTFNWDNGDISPSTPFIEIKIIRSGKRNLLATNVGAVTTRKSPIVENQLIIDETTEILNASAVTFNDYWRTQCATHVNPTDIDPFELETINSRWIHNPYVEGKKGIWRPDKSFVYYDHRSPNNLMASTNASMHIRNTGLANTFEPFWKLDEQNRWDTTTISTTKWTRNNTVTMYDFRSNELENIDALGISSAAYYGYNRTLATAIANNAQYKEIAYDGFEDYNYNTECDEPNSPKIDSKDITFRRNIDFIESGGTFTDPSFGIAHTGKQALIVSDLYDESDTKNGLHPLIKKIDFICTQKTPEESGSNIATLPLKIKNACEECLPTLEPIAGKAYNLAAWMATDSSLLCGVPPIGYAIEVKLFGDDSGELITETVLEPKGPIIEGWQQIEEKIHIPATAKYLSIRFIETDIEKDHAYFDDFRFHPFYASNMQSYVYDPVSERLMATLDENNYASFYEYNDEGLLVRTKRETEKGIVTIQEGRMELKPNNLD